MRAPQAGDIYVLTRERILVTDQGAYELALTYPPGHRIGIADPYLLARGIDLQDCTDEWFVEWIEDGTLRLATWWDHLQDEGGPPRTDEVTVRVTNKRTGHSWAVPG